MEISIYKKRTKNVLTIFCIFTFAFLFTFAVLSPPIDEHIFVQICVWMLIFSPVIFYIYMRRKGYYSAYVIICEQGIQFISRKNEILLAWEDICEIGLTDSTAIKGFGISTNYDSDLITKNVAIEKITQTYIFFEFRENAYNEIRKYWSDRIINEDIYIKNKLIGY